MKAQVILLLVIAFNLFKAQHPNWAWAKTAGSSSSWDFSGMGDQYGSTIATDKNGNSYITGHFTGTAVFGTFTVSSPAFPAVFTAKYDSSGHCLWVKHFGAHVPPPPAPMQLANNGKAIAIDSVGNCYVTGTFNGSPTDTIYFGNSKLIGYDDGRQEIFIVKYDANGNEVWATQSKYLSGTGVNVSTSISVDKAGNSYVSCYLNLDNVAGFGNLPLVSGHGAYVVKHNASGIAQWVQQLGTANGPPNGVFAYAIQNDESGNCYVTGALSGTAVLGTTPPSTVNAIGILDTYVAKLNNNGSIAWVKQFGSPQHSSYGNAIGIDAIGNISFAGNFNSQVVIGSSTLTNQSPGAGGTFATYFGKLDGFGNVLWANKLPFAESKVGAIKVNAAGDSYFVASINGGNVFCGSSIPLASGMLVGKLNQAGACQWSQLANATANSLGASGLDLDAQGDVYLAGYLQTTASFGSHTLSSAGGYDVMLAKLTSGVSNTVSTSITETANQNTVLVYPNPFDSELYVELPAAPSEGAVLLLCNLLGETLQRVELNQTQRLTIPRGELRSGMYLYKVITGGTTFYSGKVLLR